MVEQRLRNKDVLKRHTKATHIAVDTREALAQDRQHWRQAILLLLLLLLSIVPDDDISVAVRPLRALLVGERIVQFDM